jgi:hypothetical protein
MYATLWWHAQVSVVLPSTAVCVPHAQVTGQSHVLSCMRLCPTCELLSRPTHPSATCSDHSGCRRAAQVQYS